jgi:hypothetical protein
MSKLPHFKSLDELVEFWETHDFSDYVEEMEEIELDALSSDSTTLQVTLAPAPMAKLSQLARQQGMSPNDLVQTWLEEWLSKEAA